MLPLKGCNASVSVASATAQSSGLRARKLHVRAGGIKKRVADGVFALREKQDGQKHLLGGAALVHGLENV